MGDKTRKFAEGIDENDLFDTILREDFFYSPKRILQLLDDNDPAVLEIFLSVRNRLEGEFLEEGKGGKVERLLDVFNAACRNAGMVSEETVKEQKPKEGRFFGDGDLKDLMRDFDDGAMKPRQGDLKGLMRDFAQIDDDGTMDLGSVSTTGRIPIARMTGEFVGVTRPESKVSGKNVKVIGSRIGYIKDKEVSMEISVNGDDFPQLTEGDETFLVSDEETVRVKVKRVTSHKNINDLINKEGDELEKWLPLAPRDAQIVARRMFKSSTYCGKDLDGKDNLVLFEFELIE